MRALMLVVPVILAAASFAEESAAPATLLTVRGKLLKEEPFDEQASIAKGNKRGWYIYKGKYEIAGGQMKVSEQKEDGHHPAMSCKMPMKNLVMQCKFRVGDAKWLGLSLDNGKLKEHIFRAMVNPKALTIRRMSGMGPTTKGELIVEKKFAFDPAKWYTLVVELSGNEVCAQIPEAQIAIYGAHEAIAAEKDRFEFISGGENAYFDELKIWEAEPNPKWAENKAKLPPPAPVKK